MLLSKNLSCNYVLLSNSLHTPIKIYHVSFSLLLAVRRTTWWFVAILYAASKQIPLLERPTIQASQPTKQVMCCFVQIYHAVMYFCPTHPTPLVIFYHDSFPLLLVVRTTTWWFDAIFYCRYQANSSLQECSIIQARQIFG